MKEILDKIKNSDFKYDVRLSLNGKYENFTFLGKQHDDFVYYYIESEMELKKFEHMTATTSQNDFVFICKGFIAGLIYCNKNISY